VARLPLLAPPVLEEDDDDPPDEEVEPDDVEVKPELDEVPRGWGGTGDAPGVHAEETAITPRVSQAARHERENTMEAMLAHASALANVVHRERLPLEDDNVTVVQLAAGARLRLAVDGDAAVTHHHLGLPARLRHAA
jgi:hypothetical protein